MTSMELDFDYNCMFCVVYQKYPIEDRKYSSDYYEKLLNKVNSLMVARECPRLMSICSWMILSIFALVWIEFIMHVLLNENIQLLHFFFFGAIMYLSNVL